MAEAGFKTRARTNTSNSVHLPIKVFPVPGGPNNRTPFGGPRKPLKISLQIRDS